jgi:leukemia factor-related protein
MFPVAGKAANKEGAPEEKKDDGELWCNVEAQAAFLGPNLWDKTLPYDADLKVRIPSLMALFVGEVPGCQY